jgi:hypothetical protein
MTGAMPRKCTADFDGGMRETCKHLPRLDQDLRRLGRIREVVGQAALGVELGRTPRRENMTVSSLDVFSWNLETMK